MNFQIVIFLFLGLTYGVFGKSVRIYGGMNADIRNHKYMVTIRHYISNGLVCCGVIIGRRHIITAAHCIAIHPSHIPLLRIYAGTTSASSTAGIYYKIAKVDNHPAFLNVMTEEEVYRYDIAIITTKEVIEYNEFQNKIDLPTHNIIYGEIATIAGWGRSRDIGPVVTETLQVAYTSVLDKDSCTADHPFQVSYDQICVFKKKDTGICVGDSGGPLISNGKLMGIASFGIPCAVGVSDIYTNIYNCLDFIRSVVPYEKV